MANQRNRIYGFKIVRAREKEVANGSGVQSVLARKAGYMAGNANAAYGKSIYESSTVQGRFAKGYTVSCALLTSHKSHTQKWCDAENKKREQILKDQL